MWPFRKSERNDLLKSEYEEYARKMFKPEVIQESDHMILVKTVFEIFHNDKNREGCILARNFKGNSMAVQEINDDLSFSKKGIAWTTRSWRPFQPRKFAVGLISQTKHPNPMRPLSQQVNAMGWQILEMDTDYRPFISFSDWKLMF